MAPTKADKKKEEAEALAKKKKDAEALEKKKKEAEEALAKKKKDEEKALATQKKAENVEDEPIGLAASSSGRADADEGKGANGDDFLSFLQEQLAEEAAENDNGAKAAASSVEPETKDDKNKDSEKENPKKESMLQISRLCNICRECLTEGDALRNKYRCKNCDTVAQRISRLVRNDPGEDDFTSEWMDTGRMTPAERKDFYVSARLYLGPENLKALMQSKIEEIKTRTNKDRWSAESTFLDEDDIREKYKGKPAGIIENILAKAEQFTCPNKGCVLYEDITYKKARVTETTEARHVKRSAETTEEKKGEKRQKTALADKPKKEKPPPPPPKPHQLSNKEVEDLRKTHKKFLGLSDKIDEQVKEAQRMTQLVPAFMLEKSRTVKQDLESEMESICHAIGIREAKKTIKQSNKAIREETEEFIKEMGGALTTAANHLAKQAL